MFARPGNVRAAILIALACAAATSAHTVAASPRPPSGLVDFETPQIQGQRLTLDPYIDPGTGIVFRGLTFFGIETEVGLVANTATSVCVPSPTPDQKLGSAPRGSNAAGLSYLPIQADFGVALIPPCTVSVEFQIGAGGHVRLQLLDESGQVVGSAEGTAEPGFPPCFPGWGSGAITRLTATSLQPVRYAVMEEPVPADPLFVWVMDDFEYSSTAPPVVAQLDLDPDVINLASHAPWITAFVESPDAASIDQASLLLAGSVPAEPKPATVGDHDADGVPDLMVKFSREALDPYLSPGLNELELTGSLVSGEHFTVSDEIRVIDTTPALSVSVAPNPLNPAATLRFATSKPGRVKVALFDVRGRLIRALVDSPSMAGGLHEIPIDGRDAQGRALATGVYVYSVQTDEGSRTGRLTVLK